jgi:hypothetical protein
MRTATLLHASAPVPRSSYNHDRQHNNSIKRTKSEIATDGVEAERCFNENVLRGKLPANILHQRSKLIFRATPQHVDGCSSHIGVEG